MIIKRIKLERISDDKIYSATVHGFGKDVKATNLTDEIELKRFEGAKQVAIDQLQHSQQQVDRELVGYPPDNVPGWVCYDDAIPEVISLIEADFRARLVEKGRTMENPFKEHEGTPPLIAKLNADRLAERRYAFEQARQAFIKLVEVSDETSSP